jgi:hypothetical protein
VKIAHAILLLVCSLTLLLPPGITVGGSAKVAASCGSCQCKNCSCCVESPVPDAPATPAIPASNPSSCEWQALFIDSFSLFLTPSALVPRLAMPAAPSFRSGALPLYQWICAYLI